MPGVEDRDTDIKAEGQILQLGGDVLAAGQIKHIIINRDTNPNDAVAGSVVVETVPFATSSESQVQMDFEDARIAETIEQFSSANNISFTSTALANQRFHRAYWLNEG